MTQTEKELKRAKKAMRFLLKKENAHIPTVQTIIRLDHNISLLERAVEIEKKIWR